jgi:predicted amidohydrolase YtcJ
MQKSSKNLARGYESTHFVLNLPQVFSLRQSNPVATMRYLLPLFFFFAYPLAAQTGEKADLLVFNAKIYTVNARFDTAEALAVRGGKIIEVGTTAALKAKYSLAKITAIDAQGATIIPGMIDAHAHFYGYGEGLQAVNLVGTDSWETVVQKCRTFAQTHTEGWLIGRGWDQNDWADKKYPTKKALDQWFPKRPVVLQRVDGHAVIANQAALDAAGVKAGQKLVGGEVETQNGELTGILIDNAQALVQTQIPKPTRQQQQKALQAAEKNCFAVGLTSVVDCGLDAPMVELVEKMHTERQLKMRLNIMLTDQRANYEYLFRRGIVTTPRLTVRSFKLYADGALGSRGACLLHPYSDRPNYFGFLLKDTAYYRAVLSRIAEHAGMQACTHAIGDSANRVILKLYGDILGKNNARRWRIEHAQVVNDADFDLFGRYQIVPSVQPTHATSDMPWAATRLGKDREKGAYAYQRLLRQNNWLPLGTDFPVEDISPIRTFYAAVARRDDAYEPTEGYQMDNALSRADALRGMTIWAAKASFEEAEKGSIEVGKYADFVILSHDLMTMRESDLLKIKVLTTFLNGEKVFELKE